LLYATNTSHHKQETFYYEYPLHGALLPTTEWCSLVVQSSSTVAILTYWNQPLNMHVRVYYLDCHEAGSCCYLVSHIESLLRPLQVFTSISDLFTDSLIAENL
jgi:hypothetical protein